MNMCSYSYCEIGGASQNIHDLSSFLKIVAEQNRLRLLCILRDGGEHCVCEFEEHATDLSQSLISHHLADLKQAGLVVAEKRGLRMHYALSDQGRYVADIIFSLTDKTGEPAQESTIEPKGCCGLKTIATGHKTTTASVAEACCKSGKCE